MSSELEKPIQNQITALAREQLEEELKPYIASEEADARKENAITVALSTVCALVMGITGISDGSINADAPEIFALVSTVVAIVSSIVYGPTNTINDIKDLARSQIVALRN